MTEPADPISLQIEDAIVARLRTIKRSAGFHTNAGDNAEVGPIHWTDQTEVAVAVEFDGEQIQTSALGRNTGNPQASEYHHVRMTFKIVGTIRAVPEDDDDRRRGRRLNKLLADIKRAVFTKTPYFPNESKTKGWPTYAGAQKAAKQDGQAYEQIVVTGTTDYTEAIGDASNVD